jgi:hypothetical protein
VDHLLSFGPLPRSFALLADVKEAVDFIHMLKELDTPPLVLTGVTEAYRKAIIDVFFMLAGFTFISFEASIFIE